MENLQYVSNITPKMCACFYQNLIRILEACIQRSGGNLQLICSTYVATCIRYRILFSWDFVTLLHKIMCLCSESYSLRIIRCFFLCFSMFSVLFYGVSYHFQYCAFSVSWTFRCFEKMCHISPFVHFLTAYLMK